MEESQTLNNRLSMDSTVLDITGDIESCSNLTPFAQNAMQGYQDNRGYQFESNAHIALNYCASNTSVVVTQQSSNSPMAWSALSPQTVTANNCPQYCDQTSLQQGKLTISQNVEAQQDFTQIQTPTSGDIPPSPCPILPISPWPSLDLEPPFSNLPSYFSPTSPTSPLHATLLTPHPCPTSPTSSQCPTQLMPHPCSPLPTTSLSPIVSSSSLIFPLVSFPLTPLIPESINNSQVPHNQSSHQQQNQIIFQNCGQATQLSQYMKSSLSPLGNTNTVNSTVVATVMPVTSSLKQESCHQDCFANIRDCPRQIQQEDIPVSQIFHNNLQVHINPHDYQHSNEMQQNISQLGHKNPQSVQQGLQISQQNFQESQHNPQINQQNYVGPQLNNLPNNSYMSQQNVHIFPQSQQKPSYAMHFQQPQQTLENHQQLAWQSQNPHNSQQFSWQNLQTNQLNTLQSQHNLQTNQQNTWHHQQNFLSDQQTSCQPQQNLQISHQNALQPQQNLQIYQQNPFEFQQNLQTYQQNELQPQQNLQIYQQNLYEPQQNLQTNQQNALQPQQNLQIYQQNPFEFQQNLQTNQQNELQPQQNLQIYQQNPFEFQQNLQTNQQNALQPQQNLQIYQQNSNESQQNLQTNQQNALQPPQNLWTNQQNASQIQQNFEINLQNALQPQDNLLANQQNALQIQQNFEINLQNALQPQDNLLTEQQNSYQLQQKIQIKQHNILQPQQNLWTNQQKPCQPQQNIQINRQNTLQSQQNLQTNQLNPCQLQDNMQLNQKYAWQYQQNIQANQQNSLQSQQNVQINQQSTLQSQQNAQINQQTTLQSQHNLQINQQSTLQSQQNSPTHQQNPRHLVQNLPSNQQNIYQLQQNSQSHQQNVWPSQKDKLTNQYNSWETQQGTLNYENTGQQQLSQQSVYPYIQEPGKELSTSYLNSLDSGDHISLHHAAASVTYKPVKEKEQVTFQMLPKCAVQTEHLTSDSSTELVKYLITRSKKVAVEKNTMQIPSLLSCYLREFITKQLFQHQQSLVRIGYEDIQNNQKFIKFLQELNTLGQLAKSDLSKLQKNQQQHKIVFTDNASACDASIRNPMETGQDMLAEEEQLLYQETGQDMPAEEEQLLYQENMWDALIKSAEVCNQKVKNLASNVEQMAGEWYEDIKQRCQQIHRYESMRTKMVNCSTVYPNETDYKILTTEMNNKIEHNSLLQHLTDVSGCLIDFMNKWRCLETRKYVKLTLTPDDEDVKKTYAEFGAMYATFFNSLHIVKSHIGMLRDTFLKEGVKSNLYVAKELQKIKFNLLSSSWFYEKQPPTYTTAVKKKDLCIRLFGVTQSDIVDKKLYVFLEAKFENKFEEQNLCNSSINIEECKSDSPTVKLGVRMVVNLIGTVDFPRPSKRGSSCFEMYRFCLVIQLKPNKGLSIQCWSLPFAVYTGSCQLSECEGAVMWYCFAEHNLDKPSSAFRYTLTLDQVVCMLQAIISTRDPQRILDKPEIDSLKLMLKSASKSNNNEIHLKEFAKDHLNVHGEQPRKQATKVTKQGKQLNRLGDPPVKQKNSQAHTFSFFTWFMAAVNSYMYLKSCKMSGSWFFLSDDLCSAMKDVPDGSALIRASRTFIEKHDSQNPYAHLAIHIYKGNHSNVLRVAVDADLNSRPEVFPGWLEQVKDKNDVPVIRIILPDNTPLEEFKDPRHDEEQINNYRTRFKQYQKSTILLEEQFEDLSLYTDTDFHNEAESHSGESEPKQARFENSLR